MPLQVASELAEWPSNGARIPVAGINIFGMTGANAHIIVEGYQAENGVQENINGHWPSGAPTIVLGENGMNSAEQKEHKARILPLSAKDPAALPDLAAGYLEWLDQSAPDGSLDEEMLADMAWTASTGRSHFPHRAAVIFSDPDDLRAGLKRLSDADSVLGNAGEQADGRDIESNTVEAAARAYEAGHDVDFSALFAGEERRKVRLPGYPFQRRRFWVAATS